MSPQDRTAADAALEQHLLGALELSTAQVVAGYAGVGTEPHTLPLLTALRERGTRVLLPVLLPDNDVDWVEFTGEATLVPARRGLLEPRGTQLGTEAVRQADAVLCPGLAVGADGLRLGRGGGSYDRVLARLHGAGGNGAWTCVLLFDNELLDAVPSDAHDQRVDAAATPSGITRF